MGALHSRPFGPAFQEILDSFFAQLWESLLIRQDTLEEFQRLYPQWLERRNETIEGFSDLIETGLEHDKNVNIASLTGSSVSLLGGIACIGGLVLAPVTAGLSAAVAVGGLIGTTAGSVTAAGARFTGFGISIKIQRKAAALLDRDCQETLLISSLIERSSMSLEDIFSLIDENRQLIRQLQGNSSFRMIVTNPTVRMAIARISHGAASIGDYHIVLSFICSEHFRQLQGLRRITLDFETFERPFRLCASLKSSVSNIRTCITLIKNLKAGTTTLEVAGKLARLGKGALMGFSMFADVFDIGTTAKSMIRRDVPDNITKLHELLETLNIQKDELAQFFQEVEAT